MPPTTRAGARRASGTPTSSPPTTLWMVSPIPQQAAPPPPILDGTNASAISVVAAGPSSQPAGSSTLPNTRSASASQEVVVVDPSPPRAAPGSPILGTKTDTGDSLVTAVSSSQFVKSSTRSAAAPTKSPEVPAAIIKTNKSLATAGASSLPTSTLTRQVHREASHQEIIPHSSPLIPEQMSLTMAITSLEDIYNSNIRNQVSLLLQLHPWTSVSLCYSMLMGCSRVFEDTNNALRKYAIEMPVPEDSYISINSTSSQTVTAKGKALVLPSFNSGFDDSAFTSSFFSQPSKSPNPSIATSSSKKRRQKSQADAKIEPGQQLISFSKPAQSSLGIFSRAERERAITSSTETTADRERLSFIANAVIYRALSQQDYSYGRVTKTYSPRRVITKFPMTPGLFPKSSVAYVPSKFIYKGTDRGKFQPLSFNISGEGQVQLQSINLAFPYLRVSFEELRFGDYIRGRKKAPHLFEPFSKLPAEIRCIIWRFAMTPRTIELRYNYSMTKCWTLQKVPTMLHVCREARYEALKRYTLAFGIRETPDKTYFDFKRDALFLTYEKFHGEGEYEDEVERLTYHFGQSEETKRIELLAIDQDLLDILASHLEDEKDEWHDIGDDDMPEPELEVIPEYRSLRSLIIVKTQIDGCWDHEEFGCGCDPKDGPCEARKRMQQNDEAVFVSTHATVIANKTQQEYYKQLLAEVKISDPDWKVPELEYMFKRAQKACKCGRFH